MLNLGTMGAAVTLDDSQYLAALNGLDGKSSETFKRIAGYVGEAFSAYALYEFSKKSVEAFSEAEEAAEGYRSALRNSGQEFNRNTEKAVEFAKQMQQLVSIDDDVILSSMRQAAQMGISADKMDDVTKSAIGLATKLGVGLPEAMNLIVRAEQGHTEMLGRMGLKIDENATDAEKLAQLLKIGASSFGLAEDAAKRTAGQFSLLRANIGDVSEVIGERLVASMSPAISGLSGLAHGFAELNPKTQSIIINMTAFSGIAAATPRALHAIEAASLAASRGMKAFTLSLLANPLTALAVALGATAAVLWSLRDAEEDAAKKAEKLNAALIAGDQNRANDLAKIERLRELSGEHELNNAQMKEASQLTAQLNSVYGVQVGQIDALTRKYVLNSEAIQQSMSLMREAATLEAKSKLTGEELKLEQVKKENDPGWNALAAFDPRVKELNRTITSGAGGDGSALAAAKKEYEAIRNEFLSTIPAIKMQMDAVVAARMRVETNALTDASPRGDSRAAGDAIKSAKDEEAAILAKTDAQAYELWLQKEIAKATEDVWKLRDEDGNATEGSNAAIKRKYELEKNLADMLKEQAEQRKTIADYENAPSKLKDELAKSDSEKDAERSIKNALNSGDTASAKKLIQAQINQAQADMQAALQAYQGTLTATKADGVTTDEEKRALDELWKSVEEAARRENKSANELKELDGDKMKSAKASAAIGDFNAQVLAMQLGGQTEQQQIVKATQDTAKNTKEIAKNGATAKYGA